MTLPSISLMRSIQSRSCERGQIIPARDGKAAKPVKVPGHNTVRLYVLAPGIIVSDEPWPPLNFTAPISVRQPSSKA